MDENEAAGTGGAPPPSRPAGTRDAPLDEATPDTSTDGRAARRTPSWRRLVGAAATAAAVLVALALVIVNTLGAGGVIGGLFPTPTPLPRGAGSFLVMHTVPWGTLLADGGPVHPVLAGGTLDPQFTLARGQHALEYRAAPFATLRCRVSVPAAPGDDCPLAPALPAAAPSGADLERTLDLGATLDRVPAERRLALLAAVQAALAAHTSTATMMPGESYLAADGQVAVATSALQATFVYALAGDLGGAPPDGPGYCTGGVCQLSQQVNLTPDVWSLMAYVEPGWRYVASDGRVVIPFAPQAPPAVGSGGPLRLAVNLDAGWSGGWRVEAASLALPAHPACDVLADLMRPLFGLQDGVPLAIYPAAAPADGCALNTGPNFSGPPAYFLYQFGVVLAANAAAHAWLPQLPLADARQQVLARQLIGAPQ